jgi:type I restriction enzyme S subunit
MTNYTCEKCGQEFKQKNDYTRHINKKYPCITQEKLKELDVNEFKELKEKISENDSLKQLESFFVRLRDILRDNENITGDKALDVITDFLFLRLLNYELETNKEMNFISKKYNQKIKIGKEDFELDEYKKYFKWSELMKLVENIDKNSTDQKSKLLLTNVVQYIIFSGIFKFNKNTKEIYKNRRFYVKKTETIKKLLKEFNKIELDKFDVDVKGKAYELTLQKEGATNKDFSQFFTPRWIDKYMVSNAEINIKSDGSYTKIMDPACGTAGILTEYLSQVKEKSKKEKINIDKNVSEYVYGNEIVDDTLKIAHMNMLLKSGTYNTNLKCIDFLEVECFDWIDKKFDGHIIMNPPFSLTKNYDLVDIESKKVFPINTKSGTMLFLMASLNTIKKGRQLILVSPNGKEIFNKNKEYVNIRKHTVDNANLYKIAILPEGSFKPYTGVQTLILMMKKGEKTKEIQFVNLTKNKDDIVTETKICKVKYEELEKKNYSWNYKDYYTESLVKYGDIKYIELGELCNINYGDRIVKKDANDGIYPVYGGGDITFYTDDYNREGINFLISRFGMSENCIRKIIGKLWLNDSGMTISTNNNLVTQNYLNYYLLVNSNKIYSLGRGAAQKNIDIEEFNKMKLPVPPLPIQDLIVKELDSMYKQKEALQNINDEMDTFRKAKFEMLLLNCNKKKSYKLGDFITINIGGTPSTSNDEYYNGKNKWVQISDMNNKIIYSTKKMISDLGVENSNVKKIKKGQLLLSFKLSIGKIAYAGDDMYCNEAIAFFSGNKDIITDYLYYWFLTSSISDTKTGSIGCGSLNKEKLNELLITYPSVEDQEKIVQQMEVFDTLVNLQQKQIEELDKTIKERFDYHLKKCESVKSDKKSSKEDSDNDSDDLEKDLQDLKSDKSKSSVKVNKSTKNKKQVESDSEDESIMSKSKSKTKTKKLVKEESDSEDKPVIISKSKKSKKDVDSDENILVKTIKHKKTIDEEIDELTRDLEEQEA